MKNKILLVGAGGHAISCIDVIEKNNKYTIYGLIDNNRTGKIMGYNIIGDDKKLEEILINKKVRSAIISVGQIRSYLIREILYKKFKTLGFKFPTIISPLSYVSKNAKIGEGTIIMHGCIINSGATIGNNCIINTNALIEHSVAIKDNSHISTNATINGDVLIQNGSFIGSGSIIKEGVTISKNSFIKANSFVKSNN